MRVLIVSDRKAPEHVCGATSVLSELVSRLRESHDVREIVGARGGARARVSLELAVRRAVSQFKPDVAFSLGPSLSGTDCPVLSFAGLPDEAEPASALASLRRSVRRSREPGADCLVPTEPSAVLLAGGRGHRVVPVGIDAQRFSPPDHREGPLRLVFLGRLVPERGAHIALEALNGLPTWARESCHLDVVGVASDARYLQGLRRKAEGLPCTLHTDVPDVLPYLRRASVAVLPATSEDGWGRSVIEAMACGVPVLTSKGGVLDAITGGHALSVPAGNLKAVGDALRELIRSEARRQELGRAGRAHVEREHAWEVALPRWIAALQGRSRL